MHRFFRFASFILLGFVLTVMLILDASTASAQTSSAAYSSTTNCTDRTTALSHLSKAYKEQPVAMGLASSGGIVEVLTNGEGTTWSIIVTMPSGVTCLVAAGEGWEMLQPVLEGKIL